MEIERFKMRYIVLETQTYNNGTVGTLINSYTDKLQAESKFHLVLSAAAVSQLPKHCAFLLDDSARLLKSEAYIHEIPDIPIEPVDPTPPSEGGGE